MVADCLQRGGELDSSSFSHGKLSSFCFLVLFSGFVFWFCCLFLYLGSRPAWLVNGDCY